MASKVIARELLAIAREVAKINQKDYKFWVVVDGKIESGWEYTEDAKEQLGNLPSGKPGKVYQRAGLKKLGLDPDDDSAWTGGKKASPNRQADTGDAAMYFNIADFVQKRDGGIMMPEQWQPALKCLNEAISDVSNDLRMAVHRALRNYNDVLEEAGVVMKKVWRMGVVTAALTPEQAEKALKDLPRMSINEIARLVAKDWERVNFAARPYLDAMFSMDKISDPYGADSGESIVAYFLGNATSWRGDMAKAVKKELNRRLK